MSTYSTPLRFVPDAFMSTVPGDAPIMVVEITTRAIQARMLLRPDEHASELFLGVLGRAQTRFKFELYALAALSNHYSMVIGVREAGEQAALMNFINGNIARELGRPEVHDWADKFWQRRYRAINVLTEADQIDRLRYTMANGTAEGLVERPEQWPGPHCARPLADGEVLEGLWIDRSAIYRAKARAKKSKKNKTVDETKYHHWYPVVFSKLPALRTLSDDEYRVYCKEMCDSIAAEAAATRTAPVLGVARILEVDPHLRPEDAAKSPAPMCHSSDEETAKLWSKAYAEFVEGYQLASAQVRENILDRDPEFPEGGIPPTHLPLFTSNELRRR